MGPGGYKYCLEWGRGLHTCSLWEAQGLFTGEVSKACRRYRGVWSSKPQGVAPPRYPCSFSALGAGLGQSCRDQGPGWARRHPNTHTHCSPLASSAHFWPCLHLGIRKERITPRAAATWPLWPHLPGPAWRPSWQTSHWRAPCCSRAARGPSSMPLPGEAWVLWKLPYGGVWGDVHGVTPETGVGGRARRGEAPGAAGSQASHGDWSDPSEVPLGATAARQVGSALKAALERGPHGIFSLGTPGALTVGLLCSPGRGH